IVDPSKQQRHEELRGEVQRMLLMDVASSIQLQDKLRLIDSIQRLGIAYRFESEIQHILYQLNQHLNYNDDGVFTDLYSSAVLFRLMRDVSFHGWNRKKQDSRESSHRTNAESRGHAKLGRSEAGHLKDRERTEERLKWA
ncbi:hypothetical protein Ancab_022869, partial [Ancistrocladus abbreviatus]